ncbi:ferroxidase fet3 [Yamadazyma tenuis]|uniref:ferroxidase fet3 n=1 Tax=Candida tenuis TaxID=2315449 RepID=UPI0027AB6070|nr:ferroxidase fet3 [Yamadazyma tenuis]
MKLLSLIVLFSFISFGYCKTHYWNYTANYVDANPDGVFTRRALTLNGEWPPPVLRVGKGDRVVFNLTNGLEDQNTTMHFHGLFQPGSAQMDGPEMVTQCPIPPGAHFVYNFTVGDQVGTFWYHSHTAGQLGDGLRGVFVIEDDEYPFDFDEEITLTIADWYHKSSDELSKSFMSLYNPTGAEPIPQNFLVNDTTNFTWNIEPNKTYFVRIVNVGAFVSQYLYMDDHEFEIVEVDGIYVNPNTTDMLYITVAQRYGVLIRTKSNTDKNYAFMSAVDQDLLDKIPKDLVLNQTSVLVYDENNDTPDQYYVDAWDFFDDFYLSPYNNETLYEDPDLTVTVDVVMANLGNGVNYAFFNNISYVTPKVPTLLTLLSAGDDATNALIYGTNTHTYVLQKDDIVDIVVNNQDTGKHPFHLHGHVFQVISRGEGVPDTSSPVAFDADSMSEFPEYPVLRDVVYVNPQSYMVLRFKADHPGVWFFHCHIEWHLRQGLALQFVEAPEDILNDSRQTLTDNHKDVCDKVGVSWKGNAADNDKDFTDLTNQNVQVKPLPAGFTARGIVALVFSCISAFLGLVAIAIYGVADIKNIEQKVVEDMGLDISEFKEDGVEGEGESSSFLDSQTGRQ